MASVFVMGRDCNKSVPTTARLRPGGATPQQFPALREIGGAGRNRPFSSRLRSQNGGFSEGTKLICSYASTTDLNSFGVRFGVHPDGQLAQVGSLMLLYLVQT
jgi:hypothetical protein